MKKTKPHLRLTKNARPIATTGPPTGPQFSSFVPDPIRIFGLSRIAFWLRVEDFTPSSWPDVTGNLTIVQATGSRQPSASTGIYGLATALFDGVDDFMVGDMATPFAAGTQPAIWGLFRHATTPPSTGSAIWRVHATGTDTDNTLQVSWVLSGSTSRFTAAFTDSFVAATYVRTPGDVAVHTIEMRYATGSADRAFLDGSAMTYLSGTPASTNYTSRGRFRLGCTILSGSPATHANVHVRDIVAIRDAATDTERQHMNEWLQYRRRP